MRTLSQDFYNVENWSRAQDGQGQPLAGSEESCFFSSFSNAVLDRRWVFLRVIIPFVDRCGWQLRGGGACLCTAMHDCRYV